MDDTPSFSDHSPFMSPFHSPVISPTSSHNPSPSTSPKLRRLKRANSYRRYKKKELNSPERQIFSSDDSQMKVDFSEFHSPVISPTSSRNPSPSSSPKLRHLERGNLYRTSKEWHSGEDDSKVNSSDEYRKKKEFSLYDYPARKEEQVSPENQYTGQFLSPDMHPTGRKIFPRERSQSDTEITTETKGDKVVRSRRKKKSISFKHNSVTKDKQSSIISDSHPSSSEKSDPKNECSSAERKKSLIGDIRRLIDLSPRASRNSFKKSASQVVTSDEDTDDYDGPLFQATTLFVPGYDFKTKQKSPDRAPSPSKSFLLRRGSRDISITSLLDRVHSSPSLLRRSSKDKLEKQLITGNPKPKSFDNSFSFEHQKMNCKNTRDAKNDENMTADKNNKRESATQQHQSSLVGNEDYNHKFTTKDDNIEIESKSDNEHLSVSARSAILAEKHRHFEHMKKPKGAPIEIPERIIPRGNVKKISNTFEDGSIFVKRVQEKKLENNNVDCNEIGFICKEMSHPRSNTSSGISDDSGIRNSLDFSSSSPLVFRTKQSLDGVHNIGTESGYASPAESNSLETPEVSSLGNPECISPKTNETNSQFSNRSDFQNVNQYTSHGNSTTNSIQPHTKPRSGNLTINIEDIGQNQNFHQSPKQSESISLSTNSERISNIVNADTVKKDKRLLLQKLQLNESFSNSWGPDQWDDFPRINPLVRSSHVIKKHSFKLRSYETKSMPNSPVYWERSSFMIPDIANISSTDFCATEL